MYHIMRKSPGQPTTSVNQTYWLVYGFVLIFLYTISDWDARYELVSDKDLK